MGRMLFIYPDFGGSSLDFSPAVEILSSVLKNEGVDVSLLHLHEKYGVPLDYDLIYSMVQNKNYDVIGITATSYQYQVSNQIVYELKERGIKGLFILGGIHATIVPEDLETSNFDAFCIGEGEKSLCELFRRLQIGEDIYSIKGFHFKCGSKIIRNNNSPCIQNLDDLPFRDFEIMDTTKLLKLRNKWFSIAFSRGCTYSCNFCINQKLRTLFNEENDFPYYRYNSVNRAIDELLYNIKKYRKYIDVINLDDDLLLANKKWFVSFAKQYKEQVYEPYGIKYAINGRANLITEELAKQLKESGCDLVRIGFETGDEEMRNLVLAKEITDKQLKQAFSLLHQYKVRALAFCMLGIPGETKETIQTSINMLKELKPDLIRMSIFQPFVGTPIYYYCIEHNLLLDNKDMFTNTFSNSIIRFEHLSHNELIKYELLFPWYMNISMVEKYADEYKYLIAKYEKVISNHKNTDSVKNEILQADKQISNKLEKEEISHYRYFQDNSFYYELYCQDKFQIS